MAKKEQSQEILRELLYRYELNDIIIEEDDIGNVVERIYAERNEVNLG